MLTGRIHSFQSLGTVDGPGVRAVVFMQGCPLRCVCCHNPDTWDLHGGKQTTRDELLHRIRRCRAYFGKEGGVTVSGGEPLMQAAFVAELFQALKIDGIHTALDTAGCAWNADVEALLDATDLVLLDYKYTNDEDYHRYTGMKKQAVDRFLHELQARNKPTWLRHVYIPGLNDNDDSIRRLCELRKTFPCVQRIELLPFRRLCLEKYQSMGIDFPLANTPEPTPEHIAALRSRFPALDG
jgi:pyruvate formate lyase activating enzyme